MEHEIPEQWLRIKESCPLVPDGLLWSTLLCAFEEHRHVATHAFKGICEPPFQLGEIRPVRSTRKPYCRWEVDFHYMNEENLMFCSQPDLIKIFRKTVRLHPWRGDLMKVTQPSSYYVTAIYKAYCDCERPTFKIKPNLVWYVEKETLEQVFPGLNLNL